uniref:Putative sarcolemmal membrane-associated protein-like n=1 Tax=Davidia involucrata TaxID=16924 RepID=A0A5B7B637_DAVIN
MSSGSQPAINFAAESAENGTIPELISLLKSAFRPTDFDKVQHFLITREESMKSTLSEMSVEIENRKKEFDLMEKKHGDLVLMKLEIEDKLNKCKRECDGFREQVTRFSEEKRLDGDRAKRAGERFAKLLEDFTKAEDDKRELIIQLKVKSTDLECANATKRRAESEVEAWKKKFGELELRVSRLEEDTAVLVTGDPLFEKNIDMDTTALDEDLGVKRSVSHEIAGKKQTSGNGESQNEIGFGKDSPSLAREQTKESISNCGEKVNTLAGAVSACDSLVIESNKLHAAGLSMDRNWRPESRAVIEINDSDDEMPAVYGTCISNICASGAILREKETSSQKNVKGAHSGQTGEENQRRCMDNFLFGSTPKRKRNSCTSICKRENDDDDDDDKISKRKTKQLQELIHENKSSPVNDCTTMPESGGSRLRKFIPDGMDSSDSGDSSSSSRDACSDSYMNNLIAEYKRNRDNKTWTFELDMLSAFERDPELCMNAVCALYRQRMSTDKSIQGSSFSKKWGFDQFDALRVTNLAKFLIDGDPQGKLKKSVSELQQYDLKGLDDCRKLATWHSKQLFEIYRKKEDPFFFPC